jgi:exo-poly-alpha-galacturonosidase
VPSSFGIFPNMKQHCFSLFFAGLLLSSFCFAQKNASLNLLIAPGTITDNFVALLWDKQESVDGTPYQVLVNGQPVGSTSKTNYLVTGLTPVTQYTVEVRHKEKKGGNILKFKTAAKGNIYNILDYGAKADTTVKNTRFIQKAIDACTEGGTVYIPKGIFVSGALFLKSNMTLFIEEGAVLKGSSDVADYQPMIMNRFEGWEMNTYASLLNAGTLNRKGGYSVKNLRITGGGTISGGGRKLGDAMIKANGLRSRGRLILLKARTFCKNE